MSYYRTYRPQTISELDTPEISERLGKTFSSNHLPHAILFAGPKGTGKTSAARIVAKVLNCENPKTVIKGDIKSFEPCGVCESCVAIRDGRHMDVFEIDAASNRGIDEIRELREKIRLSPVQSKYKIYIIDEVHMLTTEAFNALLKTLEEPPSHAIFILATTDPDKLPATILSRCQLIRFEKAKKDNILRSLKRVVDGEKLKVTQDVLEFISEFSDGSFRDATKILEQAVTENALTLSLISKMLGKSGSSQIEFLKLLSKKDSTKLIPIIEEMRSEGSDVKFFVTGILNILHGVLVSHYNVPSEYANNELKKIFTSSDCTALIKHFMNTYVEIKSASDPYLPLIVAVVEWGERK